MVRCGVTIRNNDLTCFARDISATDLPSSASSTSFLDAKLPIESIIIINLSVRSKLVNCCITSNFNCSISVRGVCNTRLVSIPKESK